MFRFSSPFVLDLRSLALFRVALAALMLFDIRSRLPYVGLFLSDEGALSRADLLETVNRPWSFSVYFMFGEASQVTLVLLLHALAALALLLGFWTRLASVACWVLLVSLQHRNPLVLNGGDTLFSLFAFWAMFAPLNARWSLDALLSKGEGSGQVVWDNRYHGIPGAALLLQTVLLYTFTVVLKSGETWRDGDAVAYVLKNVSMVKEPAIWLSQFEAALPWLCRLTLHWEWVGCLLILCPFANGLTRLVAIFGYTAMQASFFLMLDLALFPFVSIAGCLALLPGAFWEALGGAKRWLRWEAWGPRWGEAIRGWGVRGGRVIRPGLMASLATGLALILVLFWNLRGLPDSPLKRHTPEWVKTAMYTFKLRQSWGMFAANPPRTSVWYTLEAQLANGDTLDLFYPSEPYSLRRPERFTERLPDRRWTKFLSNLRKSKYRRLRDDYLDYFVQRWNEQAGTSSKIERLKLVYFRERINLGADYGKPSIRVLETVWAKGVRQVRRSDVEEAGESEFEADEGELDADEGEGVGEDEEGDDL